MHMTEGIRFQNHGNDGYGPRCLRGPAVLLLALLLTVLQAMFPIRAEIRPRLADDAIIAIDGYRLPLSRWLPEDEPCRVVLGLHGFNDYRATFDNLAGHLRSGCTAFYAYDHRGFGGTAERGQWPGRARLVNDATNAVQLLRERYPDKPLYIIGESMGGAIAMLTLAQDHPPSVDGAVLLAPGVWTRDVQPWYMRTALWLGIRLASGLRIPNDLIDVRPSDDPDVLEYWRSHPMVLKRSRVASLYGVSNLMDAAVAAADRLQQRLLVLYGGADEIIPPPATCLLLRQLDGAAADWRFVYYPDGHHQLTRYSGEAATIADVSAWLESPAAILPSGSQAGERAREALCGEAG